MRFTKITKSKSNRIAYQGFLKRSCVAFILTFIILITPFSFTYCQFDFNSEAVGVIKDKTGKILGTAFVLEQPEFVITCAHVVDGIDSIFFQPVGSSIMYTFYDVKINEELDIAILHCSVPVCEKPLKKCMFNDVEPEDSIFYVGFDHRISSDKVWRMQANLAVVSTTGSQNSVNRLIRFYEFEGNGVPGYSGSPVLNMDGEVIGILARGFYVRGAKMEDEVLYNRAFSIEKISLGRR